MRFASWIFTLACFVIGLLSAGVVGGHASLAHRLVAFILLSVVYFAVALLVRTKQVANLMPKFIYGFLVTAPLLMAVQYIVCRPPIWPLLLVTAVCSWPVYHGFRSKMWRYTSDSLLQHAPTKKTCTPPS